ncbi:hypothetical protein K2Z83_12905 [Oscillochloris sp. ZM17-4]|uniref:VapE domain-containing protein n=1 Tax=Oscillochloris sp. ZM17-4 TaxID=2866714 RepID=UPI001C73B41A|nr:VapE domain-containing protein [Oscillochloris sp. ZM17-4]MBX0328577.1 hypothetical protein [Oscillochloris sp. ZM17-4]
MTASTADLVLSALAAYDLKQTDVNRYVSNSPLRPGSNSQAFSLTIDDPEHGAWYDHVAGSGGSLYTLADKLGVSRPHSNGSRASDTVYTYMDAAGTPLFEVVRYYDQQGDKHFAQRQPNGKKGRGSAPRVLYHLPEVLAAVAAGETVYIAEGEKDVDLLRLFGLTATCNPEGAKKWTQPSFSEALRGTDVVILPDNDEPGERHADQVRAALLAVGARVRIVRLSGLPPKGDVSDWLAQGGHDLAELLEIVQATPYETAASASATQAAAAVGPVEALANALEAAGYVFQLETETGAYFLNGRRLDDHTEKLIKAAIIDQNLGRPGHFESAIAVLAERHKFARTRDRLDGLVWDGQSHIARLADHLRTRSGDVIHYADGSTRRSAEAFLRRWLIGAVGRIFHHDQNLVLVLAGTQDAGKSQFARWLGSILPEAYYEGRFEPEAKDTTLRMIESLVWEIGELDGVTSKHAAAILKLMLTQEEVIARRPYGRHDIRGPVRASFIGTVNDDGEGFLVDPTGNRRYLVISLTGIDWSYTQIDVRQVWAEAVALYRAGERGRPCEEERAWRDKVNAERHEAKGPLFDYINEYFVATNNPSDVISNTDIFDILAAHEVIGRIDRRTQMDIAAALKRIGATKIEGRKVHGRSFRGWTGIIEAQASINRRGSAGPQPGSGGVYNPVADEVVGEVVDEVVDAHQDAINAALSTTSTTFSETCENGDGTDATTDACYEKANVFENAHEVVDAGRFSSSGRQSTTFGRGCRRGEVVDTPPPRMVGHKPTVGDIWRQRREAEDAAPAALALGQASGKADSLIQHRVAPFPLTDTEEML